MKLLLARLNRNKQGQVARTDEILESESIPIGRGSDCKLHLPDPRVALHHAVIQKGAADRISIDATQGVIAIDGRSERASLLKTDLLIKLGPYTIIVLPTPDDVDVAISLELTEPLADRTEATIQAQKIASAGLGSTWLSKRRMSWLLAGVVALIFIIWPIWHVVNTDTHIVGEKKLAKITADASWDPGPLDSGHTSFGRDCIRCHQTPFVQVKNETCESCHKSIGWHFALETAAAKQLHTNVFSTDGSEGRCAACHRDHKGKNALKRQDSPLCTDCHRDLKTRHNEVASPNIGDFKKDHPAFKLSMLVAGKTGKDAVIRVSQSDKNKLVEKSNLKFPHDVHLSENNRDGVRSPGGKRAMECKNCHVPDETGTRFKPVTMKEHCQDCHSLEFEPTATSRQVPHGKVDDVIATINEFYAQAAFMGKTIDQPPSKIWRPGDEPRTGPDKNIAWVNQKAKAITTEMMEKRVCFACHEITRVGVGAAQSWHIAPIAVTRHWLPKSRFPHSQHATFSCKKCHDVEKSQTSADIAIPDLASCQSCHSGNVPEQDKAPGSCESCHGFHTGGTRAGVPVVLPKLKDVAITTRSGVFKHPTSTRPAAK